MSNYTKNESLGGKWVKGSEIASGSVCKLVSETNPQASQFKNKDGSVKMQDVAKVMFKGQVEPMNISINRASINALVDAFGEDSKGWMGNLLTVETEKVRVAGKAVTAVYLIPQGYEKVDDDMGYAQIIKMGTRAEAAPVIDLDDEPEQPADTIPF